MKKALGEREESARSETCASRGARLKKKNPLAGVSPCTLSSACL